MIHQMPVSTMGTPTPATPILNTEPSFSRSEQPPPNAGLFTSLPLTMPASFGYPIQTSMANPLMNRNNHNLGASAGIVTASMGVMNKMQMPLQNISLQSQNVRFANSNNMPMLGVGPRAIRMQNSAGQMFNIHGNVNAQVLKMQNFQNDMVRHIASQQQHNNIAGINGPVGVQNNAMTKFPVNNNPMMMTQVCDNSYITV